MRDTIRGFIAFALIGIIIWGGSFAFDDFPIDGFSRDLVVGWTEQMEVVPEGDKYMRALAAALEDGTIYESEFFRLRDAYVEANDAIQLQALKDKTDAYERH